MGIESPGSGAHAPEPLVGVAPVAVAPVQIRAVTRTTIDLAVLTASFQVKTGLFHAARRRLLHGFCPVRRRVVAVDQASLSILAFEATAARSSVVFSSGPRTIGGLDRG